MPTEDDLYWQARMSLTPDEMQSLREKAAQSVRDAYHATTQAIAQGGDTVRHAWDDAGSAVDKFKAALPPVGSDCTAAKVAVVLYLFRD